MDCIIWGDRVCTCFCVRLSSNASASLCEKRRFSFGRQYTTERPAIQPFTHSAGVEKSGRSLRRRVQKGLRAVPQAAAQPGLPPLDGAGYGGLVHPQLFPDLAGVELLGVVEQQHLPLAGSHVLPQRPHQVAFHPAELGGVIGGHGAGVYRHVGGVGPAPPIACICHCGSTPSRSSAHTGRPAPGPPGPWRAAAGYAPPADGVRPRPPLSAGAPGAAPAPAGRRHWRGIRPIIPVRSFVCLFSSSCCVRPRSSSARQAGQSSRSPL